MGEIVCQTCEKTIEHFEAEKVSVLYGVCPGCHECEELKNEER
ncbi:uncharacterized conserved protein, contains two CXXC motifs [Caldalkalibacillus thermarum TA2.A1]|uniref:GapA-binding peptide SR1P n=1 Tax=Caldalkalibacillus thermarum (strain TA2.A1) TaxID=986075 RepID=F5L850_CALTT|nr:GapA-binding peptide SR1P [Caldalkalibacillus thermarum]EGL82463.1 uncharacterized conserved protein, contains two CXXC motifs [Caldalkalibacillus thermarum TA2.A1]QZT33187.1 GapA-binding peptide SR1P [Caldalkalibacillus thermarum TA2.A1]GGK14955.1 hypothetical protein GCM10010965_04950 [Caldalkalibacillus thermarum]